MRIQLSEQDRKRFDITEEWLEFDLLRMRVRDSIFLQSIGYPNRDDWSEALLGRQLIENGAFVYEYDEHGQKKLDSDGLPVVKQGPYEQLAWDALIWLCLRSHGVTVAWEDLEYDERGLQVRYDDEAQGKATPSPMETSQTS